MTSTLIFITTTLITSLYAFVIGALAEQQPELAGLLSLSVAILWLIIGIIFFF